MPNHPITLLASGALNRSGDTISLELHQPAGSPSFVRVVWPLRPTTAAATHYPAVAAAIVRIIAESATALSRHKAGEL